MGRRPKVEVSEDGFARFRMRVPVLIWRAFEIYARQRPGEPDPFATMRDFFRELSEAHLREPRKFEQLFPAFARALDAAHASQMAVIDASRLERAGSGGSHRRFKGVVKRNGRYYAFGRTAHGDEMLLEPHGFRTDLEAAEFRRVHYVANGFPYGVLAEYVNQGKRDLEQITGAEEPTDQQVLDSLRPDAKFLPGLAKGLDEYDAQRGAAGQLSELEAQRDQLLDSLPPGAALGFPDGLPDSAED